MPCRNATASSDGVNPQFRCLRRKCVTWATRSAILFLTVISVFRGGARWLRVCLNRGKVFSPSWVPCVCLSVGLFVHSFIHLFFYLFLKLNLFICLFVCLLYNPTSDLPLLPIPCYISPLPTSRRRGSPPLSINSPFPQSHLPTHLIQVLFL